jgi:hypothetical protein
MWLSVERHGAKHEIDSGMAGTSRYLQLANVLRHGSGLLPQGGILMKNGCPDNPALQADYFRRAFGLPPRKVLDARWSDHTPSILGPEPESILETVHKLLAQTKDFDISVLPRLSVDSRDFGDQLPISTTAVYYLVHQPKGILYIGKATNLSSRWRTVENCVGGDIPIQIHHKLEKALELGNVWLYWWTVPKECLTIIENLLIQRHRPPWNSQLY